MLKNYYNLNNTKIQEEDYIKRFINLSEIVPQFNDYGSSKKIEKSDLFKVEDEQYNLINKNIIVPSEEIKQK